MRLSKAKGRDGGCASQGGQVAQRKGVDLRNLKLGDAHLSGFMIG